MIRNNYPTSAMFYRQQCVFRSHHSLHNDRKWSSPTISPYSLVWWRAHIRLDPLECFPAERRVDLALNIVKQSRMALLDFFHLLSLIRLRNICKTTSSEVIWSLLVGLYPKCSGNLKLFLWSVSLLPKTGVSTVKTRALTPAFSACSSRYFVISLSL